MRCFNLLIIIFFTLVQFNLKGQDPYLFENEYLFHKLEHGAIYENAKLPIEINDTIVEGELYLARISFNERDHFQCLLKKDQQHWLYHILTKQYSTISYEFVDFDSIPGKEIHITTKASSGRSTWGGGFSEYTTKEYILNLKDLSCYFSLFYMDCYIVWTNNLEEMEEGSTKRQEILGSELDYIEGTAIQLDISPGILSLQQVESKCGDKLDGFEGAEAINKTIFEYEFGDGKLILKS